MTEYLSRPGRAPWLMDRSGQREELDRLIRAVRTGQRRAVVMCVGPAVAADGLDASAARGEAVPGVGQRR